MSGAFKLYYDKAEAQKETMAAELRQAADNELLLENSIKQLNDQVIQAEENKQQAFQKINVLSLRKPKLIEYLIKKGTKVVLGEFESITSPTANL